MVTISHLVKKYIDDRVILQEAMQRGILSNAALAEKIKGYIERELGKKVKQSAIVMALRRHEEELAGRTVKKSAFRFESELILKTNLADICVMKSPQLLKELDKLYRIVDFERGDTLNVILGNREVSVVANAKHRAAILLALAKEKVLHVEDNLVSISMLLPKEFLHTPGVIFLAVRRLAWDNVNILEIVSTSTELTFIMGSKDATRAYNALADLASSQGRH